MICFVILRGRGREGEKEGEKHRLFAPHSTLTRGESATWACVLTRHQTLDLSVCEMMPNQLSHCDQHCFCFNCNKQC